MSLNCDNKFTPFEENDNKFTSFEEFVIFKAAAMVRVTLWKDIIIFCSNLKYISMLCICYI